MLHILKTHNLAASRDDGGGTNARRRYVQKRHCLFSILLLLAASLFPTSAWAAIGGSGTASSPYTINTVQDWYDFATYIDSDQRNIGVYWKLTANIGINLTNPVGNIDNEFEGFFDGGGYTITINSSSMSSSADYIGLFATTYGTVNSTTYIKNLNVVCPAIHGRNYSGALIGEVRGALTLENVHVTQSGTSNKTGHSSGGFIGKFYWKSSYSGTVNITNCSYVNTSTLNFTRTADFLDCGGFVGYITDDYGAVTFTDCLVYLNTVTFASSTAEPFGGIIGAALSSVTMIRCVQEGIPCTMSASANRAYVAGFVRSGKSVTGYDCLAYYDYNCKGTKRGSTGTLSGFATSPSQWGNYYNQYRLLERRNNSGGTISSNTRGNERWGISEVTTYPKLTSTNYAIKITTGSGFTNGSAVSGVGTYSDNVYYRSANTNLTVTTSTAVGSHNRVVWSFEPAYQPSSGTAYTLSPTTGGAGQ